MTAGERLQQLAGTTGTAAALLLMIGQGATAGEALRDHSGLESGTAIAHLLEDRDYANRWAAGGVAKPRRGTVRPGVFRPRPAQPFQPSRPVALPPRRKENDEALLLACLL